MKKGIHYRNTEEKAHGQWYLVAQEQNKVTTSYLHEVLRKVVRLDLIRDARVQCADESNTLASQLPVQSLVACLTQDVSEQLQDGVDVASRHLVVALN